MFMGRKTTLSRLSVLSKLIYRLNAIPIKMLVISFVDIDKLILKFIRRGKDPEWLRPILKEKNKVERLTPPHFKTLYKATVKGTVVLIKNRQINQRNRIKSPEIDSHRYSQLIFTKEQKDNRKDRLFNK